MLSSLTHPYLAQAWAKRGADLRIAAPGQSQKIAMMGVLNPADGELLVHTSRTKKSADFVASLALIDRRFGPAPGRDTKPVRLVLDNGPVRTSKLSRAALAERAWIEVEWLPRSAPELNVERSWRDLLSRPPNVPRRRRPRALHSSRHRRSQSGADCRQSV
jgi:hypothetical protein